MPPKPRPLTVARTRGSLVSQHKLRNQNAQSRNQRSNSRLRERGFSSNTLTRKIKSLKERRNDERRLRGTSLNNLNVKARNLPSRLELLKQFKKYSDKNTTKNVRNRQMKNIFKELKTKGLHEDDRDEYFRKSCDSEIARYYFNPRYYNEFSRSLTLDESERREEIELFERMNIVEYRITGRLNKDMEHELISKIKKDKQIKQDYEKLLEEYVSQSIKARGENFSKPGVMDSYVKKYDELLRTFIEKHPISSIISELKPNPP